jgi:hypothetical protein
MRVKVFTQRVETLAEEGPRDGPQPLMFYDSAHQKQVWDDKD